MLKALYYPHTDISNPVIIKNSLLLWDFIETIVPHPDWMPQRFRNNRLLNEAVDLVVRSRVPTETERRSAHNSLEQLLLNGLLPPSLIQESKRLWGSAEFLVYPEKFLHNTWHMFEQGGLAHWDSSASNYLVPPAVGFIMMSILADFCAGSQVQKVTDRVEAYAWISKHNAKILGCQYITGLDVSQVAPAYDRLVTLSLEVLDGRQVPLRRLLDFRKRELRSQGADYSAMRRHYFNALRLCLERIGKEARSENDVLEIEQQFKEEMKQDYKDLRKELGQISMKTLLSTKIGVSALILGGRLIAPILGVTSLPDDVEGIGIIPLLKAAIEYHGARRDALRRHTMSWLFLGTRHPLSLL